jgi:sugar phosphate isomerase/epimerase
MAGDDLKCLHIHDNMRASDLHLFPTMGTLDWKDFCQALVDINYQGVFMMETGRITKGSEKTTDLEFKLLRSLIDDITADYPSLLAE